MIIIFVIILIIILLINLVKNIFNLNHQSNEQEGSTFESTAYGQQTSESTTGIATEPTTGTSAIDETGLETNETVEDNTTVENSSTSTTSATEKVSEQGVNMDFTNVSFYLENNDQRYNAYLKSHQSKTAEEIVLAVNMNHDFDFYTNIIPISDAGSIDVICNKYYQLSKSFTPENLVSVTSGYYVNDGKEYKLAQTALDAFIKMSDAAQKDGLTIKIISGYRTYTYQENLYNKYKANNGQAAADRFSARPGHSEHETGLAIDINDVSQSFENTREFVWLQQNAYLYGYILRYPDGKEATTGYMYEPWHYRFLGVDLAKKVFDSGLTYDEYYAKYLLK
ncbi:M15 family metallopeptidase [Fusibacter bizertensis]